MKKDFVRIIVEVIVVIFLVIWSIPIWDALANQLPNIENDISCMENIEMKFINEPVQDVILTSKKEINELEPTKVLISNNGNVKSCGNLYLSYAKTSFLDYRFVKVRIEEQLFDLNSFMMTTNNDKYIFIIDVLDLEPLTNREYEVLIYLNEEDLMNFKLEYYDYNINLSVGY